MTIWTAPSFGSAIGWAPAGERSRMASRRLARPARPSSATQVPAPSGPRRAMASRVRRSSSRSIGPASGPRLTMPLMPHMGIAGVGAGQLVEVGPEAGAEALRGEDGLAAPPAGLAQPPGDLRVVEQAGEGGGELRGVVGIDEETGLAVRHHLRRGAAAGRETGLAGPHGLQVDEPEPLAAAGHGEEGGPPVELGPGRLAHEAGEERPLRREPQGRGRPFETGPVVAVADHDQPE